MVDGLRIHARVSEIADTFAAIVASFAEHCTHLPAGCA
jgi:hypothetical protein